MTNFQSIQPLNYLTIAETRTEFGEINGVPVYVFDPHNEAFKYWFEEVGRSRALLLHVDAHADMGDFVPAIINPSDNLDLYVKLLSINNFIAAGVHEELVGEVFHVEFPYYKADNLAISAYIGLETEVRDKNIRWKNDLKNYKKTLTREDLFRNLHDAERLVIWDFDLDAFLCVDELRSNLSDAELRALFQARIDYLMEFLESLPKPALVTIAQSTEPEEWTPKAYVDEITSYFKEQLEKVLESKR